MRKVLIIAIMALPLLALAEEGKTEECKVGFLGVSTEELSNAMKTALNVEYGILVSKVHEDSPAEKAGLKEGDIILKIDDEKITNFESLSEVVEARPNKKAKITLLRSNKKITKTAEIAEKKKKKIRVTMDIPDVSEMKELIGHGMKEFKEGLHEAIEDLHEEIEKLKVEIEEIKKKIE